MADLTLSVTPSTPSATLPTASAATFPASENLPLNNKFIDSPSLGISSTSPSNLLVMFSLIKSAKSLIACFGFSNADIIFSPKSANKSTRLPVIAPITPRILANLF